MKSLGNGARRQLGGLPQSDQKRSRSVTTDRGTGARVRISKMVFNIRHHPADEMVGINAPLPQCLIEFISIPVRFATQSANTVQ